MITPSREELDELLTRSISYIFPSKKELEDYLLSGERLKIYLGADATGPELHLGHATSIIFLEKLRRLGHEVIFLFGDFTALIGDPSGKDATRRRLSEEEVEKNIQGWKAQVQKILKLDDKENPAKILKNSAWLAGLTLKEMIEMASTMTVQQMLERDMFEKRAQERKPIYLHEFLYPLMQGYDSVAMNVTAEVGGNDQLFNMLVGRDLQKRYNNTEKFVIATVLLEDPRTGKKLMNKSEGSYIAMSDAPNDMYGKAMALPDEVVIQVLTDCTFAPMEEVRARADALAEGANPRDIKMKLAYELVKTYHNENAAVEAEEFFVSTFQKNETPEDVEEITAHGGDFLGKVLVEKGIVGSNNEFRRLVEGGGVSNMDAQEKIDDHTYLLEKDATFKIGKKKFVRIKLESRK